MAGILPVPAPAPSESPQKGLRFFDALTAELQRERKPTTSEDKNSHPREDYRSRNDSQIDSTESFSKSQEIVRESSANNDGKQEPGRENEKAQSISENEPVKKDHQETQKIEEEKGSTSRKEEESATKTAEEGASKTEESTSSREKEAAQPVEEDKSSPTDSADQDQKTVQDDGGPSEKSNQEVDFGFPFSDGTPVIARTKETSQSKDHSEEIEEDVFLEDLSKADEVLRLSDEEFFAAAENIQEQGINESTEELESESQVSLEEETQAFVEFLLTDSQSSEKPEDLGTGLSTAGGDLTSDLVPVKETIDLTLETAEAIPVMDSVIMEEAVPVTRPVSAEETDLVNQPEIEVIVDEVLQLMQDPEIAQKPKLSEMLSELVEEVQIKIKDSILASQNSSNPRLEKLLTFLEQLGNHLQNPTSERAQILFSSAGEEVLGELKQVLTKALYETQGKVELGKDFELLSSPKTTDKSQTASLNKIPIERIESEVITEKSETRQSSSISPVSDGKSESASSQAVSRLVMKIHNTDQQNQQQTANTTSTPQGSGEHSSGHSEGDGSQNSQRQGTQLERQTIDLKAQSREQEDGFKLKLSSAKSEAVEEAPLKKEPSKSDNQIGLSSRDTVSEINRRSHSGVGSARSVMNQIIHKVKALRPPKVNVLRITLNPKDMGKVKVELKDSREGLKVRFQAETTAVKEIIDRNLPQLRDSLRAQGLDVNKLEVEVREDSNQESSRGRGNRGKQNKNRKNQEQESEFSIEEQTSPEKSGEHKINEYA